MIGDYEVEDVNIYKYTDLIRAEVYASVLKIQKLSYRNIIAAVDEGITIAADRACNERDDVFSG